MTGIEFGTAVAYSTLRLMLSALSSRLIHIYCYVQILIRKQGLGYQDFMEVLNNNKSEYIPESTPSCSSFRACHLHNFIELREYE